MITVGKEPATTQAGLSTRIDKLEGRVALIRQMITVGKEPATTQAGLSTRIGMLKEEVDAVLAKRTDIDAEIDARTIAAVERLQQRTDTLAQMVITDGKEPATTQAGLSTSIGMLK